MAEFHSQSFVPAVTLSPRNAISVLPFETNDRHSIANINARLFSGYAPLPGRENNGAPPLISMLSTDTAA